MLDGLEKRYVQKFGDFERTTVLKYPEPEPKRLVFVSPDINELAHLVSPETNWRPGKDGYIERVGNQVVILCEGAGYANAPGVELVGYYSDGVPLYRKIFTNRQVFLEDELPSLVDSDLLYNFHYGINSGLTGFTTIKSEDLERWGMEEGEYEAFSREVFDRWIEAVAKYSKEGCYMLPQTQTVTAVPQNIVDGNINQAIDGVSRDVRRERSGQVGGMSVTCAEWVVWDEDDASNFPVCVSRSEDEYKNLFASLTDFLIVTGGREIAHQYDYIRKMLGKDSAMVIPVIEVLARRNPGSPNGLDGIYDAARLLQSQNGSVGVDFQGFEGRYDTEAREKKKQIVFAHIDAKAREHVYTILRQKALGIMSGSRFHESVVAADARFNPNGDGRVSFLDHGFTGHEARGALYRFPMIIDRTLREEAEAA